MLAAAALIIGTGLTYIVVGLFTGADHQQDVRLNTFGVAVFGTVTASFPKEHGTIEYVFQASGRTLSAASSVSGPNARPEQLRPGDKVRVVYDRRDPSVSCACSPSEDLANQQANNWALALFGGFAAAVVVFMTLTRTGRPG